MHAVCCWGSAAGHSAGRVPSPLSLGAEASDPAAASGAILPEHPLVMTARKRTEDDRWGRIRRTLRKS